MSEKDLIRGVCGNRNCVKVYEKYEVVVHPNQRRIDITGIRECPSCGWQRDKRQNESHLYGKKE